MGAYFCPMHAEVKSTSQDSCPVCGMAFVTADARFPMVEHLLANPFHLALVALVMLILMAGAMMLLG